MAESAKSKTQAELSKRIEQAAKVMAVSPDIVRRCLEKLGIQESDEDALVVLEAPTTKEGDARRVFVEEGLDGNAGLGNGSGPVKIARFALGWPILKGSAKLETKTEESGGMVGAIQSLIKSTRQIAQYKDEELLAEYGSDCSTTISDELKKRSDDKPFVVFDKGTSTVNVEVTTKLLRLVRRQQAPKEYKVGEDTVRVYRVGEFPAMWIFECPLHAGVALADGYCDECGEDWSKVSDEDRIKVRIAKDMNSITANGFEVVAGILEGRKVLPSKVQLAYEEMKEEQKLPVLKRRPSVTRGGKADPFCYSSR